MGNINNKLSQIVTSVKPTALNLQTRPFAPLATQEEESVSQVQDKSLSEKLKSSENILEKLINTPKSESAIPVQRRLENRFGSKMIVQAKLTHNQPVQLPEDVKEEKIEEGREKDIEFSNLEPSVQNERYSGISHIQRELVDENAASKVDSLDVVYELVAHKLAYKGIDGIPAEMGQWLDNQGYQRDWLGTVQGSGLFCGLIMPKEGSDKQPVLAFKGTDFGKTGDALADVDPVAVGFTAFKLKQDQIQGLISQAGGKVVVTGHSLGGALAQHAASAFTGNISKVVTFQAPGLVKNKFDNLITMLMIWRNMKD